MNDEPQPSPWVTAAQSQSQSQTPGAPPPPPAPSPPARRSLFQRLRDNETAASVALGMLLGGGGVLLLGAVLTMLR